MYCNCESIDHRLTYKEIRRGNQLFLISVKIPYCTNCGERYFDPADYKTLSQSSAEELACWEKLF
jgi:YgiT-type zinc finger domain-containing protein